LDFPLNGGAALGGGLELGIEPITLACECARVELSRTKRNFGLIDEHRIGPLAMHEDSILNSTVVLFEQPIAVPKRPVDLGLNLVAPAQPLGERFNFKPKLRRLMEKLCQRRPRWGECTGVFGDDCQVGHQAAS
jgi:hypothetical protein